MMVVRKTQKRADAVSGGRREQRQGSHHECAWADEEFDGTVKLFNGRRVNLVMLTHTMLKGGGSTRRE
jgi:hypothetical protein